MAVAYNEVVTLETRTSVAYTLVSIAWSTAAVATLVGRDDGPPLLMLLAAVVAGWFVCILVAKDVLVRRASARLAAAFRRGDTETARKVLHEIVACASPTPGNLTAARLTEASLLGVEGRHEQASRLLEAIDPAPLASLQRALLFNNLAYARALAGRGDDAVDAAEKARRLCPPHADARTRARILGTLGIARVRAGQYDTGVALLVDVLQAGGTPRDQAVRAYFLGEGLRAIGRVIEARDAWKLGAREAPASEWGKRSAERLSAPQPAPFR
jgi:tetratricopeptide (TPR) repeat protein